MRSVTRWVPWRSGDGVWKVRNFRLMWTGWSVSLAGNLLTTLALPLTAVLTLGASAAQMGVLTAAGTVPSVLLTLVGGVWADRIRRQPLLVWDNVADALLIVSVPVVWALGALSMTQLYAVALVSGVLRAFSGPASSSFYPMAVGREHLAEANRLNHVTAGALNVVVPPAAGVAIQILAAPLVMLADAASFLFAAVMLGRVRVAEAPTQRGERRHAVWEMREGWRFIAHSPTLRAITGFYAVWAFAGWGMVTSVFVLYVKRVLGFSPFEIGALSAFGGASLAVCTFFLPRMQRRIGVGGAIMLGAVAYVAGMGITPALHRDSMIAYPASALAAVLAWGGVFILNVSLGTIQQTITPDRMLGRVSSAGQFLSTLLMPLGALTSGLLGDALTLRTALWVAFALDPLIIIILFMSPLPRLAKYPSAPDTDTPAAVG